MISKYEFNTYEKRPLPIKARKMYEDFTVHTLEGTMQGKAGDYLVIGIDGENYPCHKKVFEKSYRIVVN